MRAALLTQYREDFVIGSVPDPTITSPNDVIVRVGAAGFCRTDIHMWDGQFDEAQKGPGSICPSSAGMRPPDGWPRLAQA